MWNKEWKSTGPFMFIMKNNFYKKQVVISYDGSHKINSFVSFPGI